MADHYSLDQLRRTASPVILDFSAPWCVPCRALEPAVRRLEEEYRGRVEVWRINADENPEMAKEMGVYGIPTLVAMHAGKEVARRTGTAAHSILNGFFDAALTGIQPVSSGPAPLARLLRLASGSILIIAGILLMPSIGTIFLMGLGALVLFAAVYDRCPVYRMVSARAMGIFQKKPSH
jgi:thioredoxin 1